MEPEFHSIESLTTWRPLSSPPSPSPTPLGQVSPTSETVDTSSIVSVRELVKIFEVSQQENSVVVSYPKRRRERLLPRVPPKPLSSILVSNQPRRVVLRKVVFLNRIVGSFLCLGTRSFLWDNVGVYL